MIDFSIPFFEVGGLGVIAERMIVLAVLILVTPFLVVAIFQLRLLNRFFKTPAAPVWMFVTVALFFISLAVGAWYLFTIYG